MPHNHDKGQYKTYNLLQVSTSNLAIHTKLHSPSGMVVLEEETKQASNIKTRNNPVPCATLASACKQTRAAHLQW